MIKAFAAASCVLICCLGNPADAATYNANDDVIHHNNRTGAAISSPLRS